MNDKKRWGIEKEELLGKTVIFMQPWNFLGGIYLNYTKGKIIKVYKKSIRIEADEKINDWYDGLVKKEKLEKYYFRSMEEAVSWNKKILQKSIKEFKKELEGFTEKHPEYKEKLRVIKQLTGLLEVVDDFSIKNYNKWKGGG